jgi:hypothetical protein
LVPACGCAPAADPVEREELIARQPGLIVDLLFCGRRRPNRFNPGSDRATHSEARRQCRRLAAERHGNPKPVRAAMQAPRRPGRRLAPPTVDNSAPETGVLPKSDTNRTPFAFPDAPAETGRDPSGRAIA